MIVAGGDHSFAKTSDGVWYAFGCDLYSALGLEHYGVYQNTPTPKELNILEKTIDTVVSNKNNSFAKTSDGSWYSFGNNHAGQLGLGELSGRESNFRPSPTEFIKIKE